MKLSFAGNTTSLADARLAVSASPDMSSPVFGPSAAPSAGILKLESADLSPGSYYWAIERNGTIGLAPTGPAKVPAASHKLAFGTCCDTGSNHEVFDTIRNLGPDMYFNLGDIHYHDRESTDPLVHIADFDEVFTNPRHAQLLREVTSVWVADDHDGGPNDRYNDGAQAEAFATAWRLRAPYPPLGVTGANEGSYLTFDVGRVRYVITDQRRYASNKTATDNASKTMLGATQKTWFKDIISNSAGYLIVWGSTRVFHAVNEGGGDHWGGFNTERVELCDHIKANASGRVIVLTGDRHEAGIDDGTNCNYATGGDPIPICMGAPLDRFSSTHGNGTFSRGVFSGNGQFGVVDFTDTGGATINVRMAVHNSTAELDAYSFDVTLNVAL